MRGRGALLLLLASLIWLGACSGAPEPAVDLSRLPQPETERMASTVVSMLDERRGAVSAQPESATAWGRYGEALDAHGLFAEALVCYEAATELEPETFRWQYDRGMMSFAAGAPAEATLAIFERARDLDPRYPGVHYMLGTTRMESGDTKAALADFRELVRLRPREAAGHVSLGEALLFEDQVDEGVRELELAEELAPGVRRTLAALARGYRLQGALERADEAAVRAESSDREIAMPDQVRTEVAALAVDPRSLIARSTAAMNERGDFAAAIPDLLRFLEADPDSSEAHVQLGQAYQATGRPKLALEALDRALELNPELADAHYRRAVVLAGQQRFAEAERTLRRALTIDPRSADAHLLLGSVLAEQSRPAEAAESLRRALRLQPDLVGAGVLLGNVQATQGRLAEAVESYRSVLSSGSEGGSLSHEQVAEVRARLGTALARLGDFPAARDELAEAVALGRHDPGTLRNLASAYMRLQDWRGAVPHLEAALAQDPGEPGLSHQLGRCLEMLGRTDEAVERYRAGVARDPRGAAAKRLAELTAAQR